ncbi:MAG: putative glycoside hydrolase [Clostridia bacterium]
MFLAVRDDGGVPIVYVRGATNMGDGVRNEFSASSFPRLILILASVSLVVLSFAFLGSTVEASPPGGWWVPGSVEIRAAIEGERESRQQTVRGFYLPASFVGDEARMEHYLEMLDQTELNAVVIDIKDDRGWLTYDSDLPRPREYDAVNPKMGDLADLADMLRERDIYAIGRLVVFKDDRLGMARPDLAIVDSAGNPWRDRTGAHWMDPYSREVWDYNLAVAEEVIEKGFPEVQLDYVRFPTDGNVRSAEYRSFDEDIPRSRIIANFMKEFHWRVFSAAGRSSVDVFGLIPTTTDDMNMGQQWEEVVEFVDYVSPMVYPSHYGPNIYGLPVPNEAPYETVWHTMRDGLRRMKPGDASIRPWLQDFSWGFRYGSGEVRAQIEASEDHDVGNWLLWNPGGVYTWDALRPPGEEDRD